VRLIDADVADQGVHSHTRADATSRRRTSGRSAVAIPERGIHQTSRNATRRAGLAQAANLDGVLVLAGMHADRTCRPRAGRACRVLCDGVVDDEDLIIGPVDAGRLVERGEAILIDVVESGAWATLREVPAGSLRVPPPEFRERAEELPFERTLITFCT